MEDGASKSTLAPCWATQAMSGRPSHCCSMFIRKPHAPSPVLLIASYSCVSRISLDPKEWVVFGGTPGSSPLGQGATQIKMVKNLVGHPLARQGPHFMDKDYLLVELLQPLKLDSQVQASCLASDSISPTQTCLTAGWVRSQTEGNKCRLYYSQT